MEVRIIEKRSVFLGKGWSESSLLRMDSSLAEKRMKGDY
jgi:hypothetical protein